MEHLLIQMASLTIHINHIWFHSSPSFILIWWYPLLRSTLLNHCDRDNSSNMCSILGIGYLYLMVMLFTLLLSMHILHVPSFLGTNRVGTTQGLRLSLTYPLCINSSAWLCNYLVSVGFVLYAGLLGKEALGIRST